MSVSYRFFTVGVLSLSISWGVEAQEAPHEKQIIIQDESAESDGTNSSSEPSNDSRFGISGALGPRSVSPTRVDFGIERKRAPMPFTPQKFRGDKVRDETYPSRPDDSEHYPRGDSFQWGPAIRQSLLFLAVQHGYAMTQPKTRHSLRGPFLKDYIRSVKSLSGWNDGGKFFTNYVAHPMQGSFMGFIQVQNDPRGRGQTFGRSAAYWKSRMKALAWSAAWSTQFEIGPISQASLGNVGLKGKQTYVDMVMTPTAGIGMLIVEDVLDKYVVQAIERRSTNYFLRILFRTVLNPTRSVANIIRLKSPWHRDRGLRP